MADFLKAYNAAMPIEGGWANVAGDKGGETYKGVARNRHPDWVGWTIIDQAKKYSNFPKNLAEYFDLEEHVQNFYEDEFWNVIHGDQIPDDQVGIELFDTAINMGPHYAGVFLQGALNILNRNQKLYLDLKEDGSIGPKTIAALQTFLKSDKPEVLLLWMNVLQGQRYIDIMEKDPTQEKFARGWAKRVVLRKDS